MSCYMCKTESYTYTQNAMYILYQPFFLIILFLLGFFLSSLASFLPASIAVFAFPPISISPSVLTLISHSLYIHFTQGMVDLGLDYGRISQSIAVSYSAFYIQGKFMCRVSFEMYLLLSSSSSSFWWYRNGAQSIHSELHPQPFMFFYFKTGSLCQLLFSHRCDKTTNIQI